MRRFQLKSELIRTTFFVFIFLLLIINCHAQEQTLSTLKQQLLKNNPNKNIELITNFADRNIKKDTLLFKESTNLLKSVKSPNSMSYYYNLYAEFSIEYDRYSEAQLHLSKAEEYLHDKTDHRILSLINKNYGAIQYCKDDYEKAIEHFKKALDYAKLTKDEELISDLYAKMSITYMGSSDYDKARIYTKAALKIRQILNNSEKLIQSYTTLGNIYFKTSDFTNALEQHFTALRIAEKDNNSMWIGNCYNNIGAVYNSLNEIEKSLEYYLKGIEKKEVTERGSIELAYSYNNLALIYKKMKNYDQSLVYHFKSLDIKERKHDTYGIGTSCNNIGNLYISTKEYQKAKDYINRGLQSFKKINNKSGIASSYVNLALVSYMEKNFDKALDYAFKANELALETKNKQYAMVSYGSIVKIYEAKNDYKNAYSYFQKYFSYKDSIYNVETSNQINEIQTKYETEKKDKENLLLRKDKQINELKYLKSQYWRRFLIVLLILSIAIIFLIFRSYYYQRKANLLIQQEKDKTDQLMLNILPFEIAKELKETGKTVPQHFENVTVMFSDLVNFTQIASNLKPEKVISELNDLFTEFDTIAERNSCERIKTIGDAYLAVSGMPEANENHAINCLRTAIEMMKFIEFRNQNSSIQWAIRIGIHTGSVVGGIVGVKKYIYDIFGDAINMSSRIENHCLPMEINISETTYELVKDYYQFKESNSVSIKGKGEMTIYSLSLI